MYQVYVIENPDDRFYIGVSNDPETRLNQHNDGVSEWTRNKGPWTLAWTSEEMSITQARKLENWLKRQKGGNGFFQKTGLTQPKGSKSRGRGIVGPACAGSNPCTQ